jgi:isocitrate dehydrogenase
MGTEKGTAVATSQIVNLLNRIDRMNLEFIKLETLCTFDGELGYSLGQGQ